MKPFILGALAALSVNTLVVTEVAAEPSGEYLAGRQARYSYDFDAAARYFTQALIKDSSNQAILEQAVVAMLSLGQFERALPIAKKMDAADMQSQVGSLTILTTLAQAGDFDGVLARLDADRGIGPLGDGLIKAWAQVGKGDMTSALASFDAVTKEPGLRDLALYHKALALASVGDYETTVDILSGKADGDVQYTRRMLMAWSEALSQLERFKEAQELLDNSFTELPADMQELRHKLVEKQPITFSVVKSAQDGIAEVLFSLGQALTDGAGNDFVLMFARAAEYITPEHVDAILMSAEMLSSLERYELAAQLYQKIPRSNPLFQMAELGRAQALGSAGKTEAAIEVLTSLAKDYPDVPAIPVSLGDLYRENERFADATGAYEQAIQLYENDGEKAPWFAYYSRAVSLERSGKWEAAEKDFRSALKENPDQPQVLNYLGYAMVEKRVNLDEALGFIKRAVELEPDSGYIVDSLGWVQYQLGDFQEAAINLERAAELMPVDPVVNDHLGDALWKVGRKNEAEFQWRRALSFIDPNKPSPDIDPSRVRQKLSVGLDAVQKAEQVEPKVKKDKKKDEDI